MTRRRFILFTASLALLLIALTVPAHAQQWRQELQVLTTVPHESPTHIFLDSIATLLGKNPDMLVRRSPKDEAPMPFHTLQDTLYEEGIDLRSASHVFLRYRFDLNEQGSGVIETIQDLHFIFRLDESESDLPILYVDTTTPIVSNLLVHRGIPSPVNMRSMTPFRQHLAFLVLHAQQETAVVEMGRRPLRDTLDPRQAALIEFLNEKMGLGPGEYALTTRYQERQDRMQADAPTRVAADSSLFQ